MGLLQSSVVDPRILLAPQEGKGVFRDHSGKILEWKKGVYIKGSSWTLYAHVFLVVFCSIVSKYELLKVAVNEKQRNCRTAFIIGAKSGRMADVLSGRMDEWTQQLLKRGIHSSFDSVHKYFRFMP